MLVVPGFPACPHVCEIMCLSEALVSLHKFSDGKTAPAFEHAAFKYTTSTPCLHPRAEAMYSHSASTFWLICTLHDRCVPAQGLYRGIELRGNVYNALSSTSYDQLSVKRYKMQQAPHLKQLKPFGPTCEISAIVFSNVIFLNSRDGYCSDPVIEMIGDK